MKNKQPNPTPLDSSALPATVQWRAPDGTAKSQKADSSLLDANLQFARPIRTGNRYPRQRNYHGKYFFSQTLTHVWHESLLEASVLTWLDMRSSIEAITSQPMTIEFADGRVHTPDFFALHSDRRQVVYDVKPKKFLTDEVLNQFAKTRELCHSVGWGYEVHTGFTDQMLVNLNWFAAFKHPGYHPGTVATSKLLAAMSTPMTVRNAARAIDLGTLAAGRAAVYHLSWIQALTVDLTQPISDNTVLERNNHVHA